MSPDLSIDIPTFDRAESLRRTLKSIADADRGGLEFELIVVDNHSTDLTREMIDSIADRISILYLFEVEAGKNRALNRTLADAELGRIVVFTDDDVDPGWLQEIARMTDTWLDHSVFGGRIDIVWPHDDVPGWAIDPGIQEFAFTFQDEGPYAHVYGEKRLPFGPNYWIRSRVLNSGRRFAEHIGPHPTNRILGDESLFLLDLCADGHAPVYIPDARVGHRIQERAVTVEGIRERAWQMGRGLIYILGIPQPDLLAKRRWHLVVMRYKRVLQKFLAGWAARLDSDPDERVRRAVYRRLELAFEIEALRVERSSPSD